MRCSADGWHDLLSRAPLAHRRLGTAGAGLARGRLRVRHRTGWARGVGSYSVVGGQTFADSGGAAGWQAQQIERVGGRGTLLIARLDDWLGTLWHGRRLALTLVALGWVAAFGCRFVAGLLDDNESI